MFSRSTTIRRNEIINYLNQNKVDKIGTLHLKKLRYVRAIIQKNLAGQHKSAIVEKYFYYSKLFHSAKLITKERVEKSGDKDILNIFHFYKSFILEQERFISFFENDLVFILRQRFGFNPLASRDNFLQAVEIENTAKGKIPRLIKSSA